MPFLFSVLAGTLLVSVLVELTLEWRTDNKKNLGKVKWSRVKYGPEAGEGDRSSWYLKEGS